MSQPLEILLRNLNLSKVRTELYKRSFYDFTLDAFKTLHNGQELTPNWHIKYICDRLQKEAYRVINNEPREKHLLINVPPRTLKSELVNVFFSAYCWVLKDSIQFISSSYSASLSITLSTQARRLIESDWFKEHFTHVQLSKDENTKSRFTTTNGGLRYSTSTGGTVTGMGGSASYGGYSTTYQNIRVTKPTSENTILMLKEKPQGISYNAQLIYDQLREEYSLND